MRKILISLITLYQKFLSPDTGIFSRGRNICGMFPSCSEYTKQAVEKYGIRGIFIGARRVLRCHPFQEKQIDPLV